MRVFGYFVYIFFAICLSGWSASAAVYTVTNTNNDGAGSLRQAINTANSTPDDDTINFNIVGCENGVCTINLSSQLVVNSAASSGSLSIFNSTGAGRLIVRGKPDLPGPLRVLAVQGGANLTIDGVTLADGGGLNPDNGACVENDGSLTLKNSVVRGCRLYQGGYGAGIYNAGTLTLLKTTVSDARHTNGSASFGGGGIYNVGTAFVTDSIISDNFGGGGGGGIYSTGALTMSGSTVSGNSIFSGAGGGGISLGAGTAMITNSTVSNNTADSGGGINTGGGNFTLIGTTVSGNTAAAGGGIYNDGGNVTVKDSLIDSNTFDPKSFNFGGGIHHNSGVFTLINSTVSRNQTRFLGGGIFNASEMFIINSTISRNSVGPESGSAGISNNSEMTMRNSIVADNFADYNPDIYGFGTFTSKGNNLIGNSDTGGKVSWQSSDILDQSPRLAPLGNYGGATQTFALTNNSLALNAGNNCVITANGCGDNNPALPNDQRGAARVGNVDIGAFELNNTANGGNYRAVTTDGKINVPFNYPITSDSGAFTYSVTAGSLPPGLVLSNPAAPFRSSTKDAPLVPQAGAYAITGTPTLGGTYDYTITATDGTNSVSTNYRTTIQAAPTAASVNVGGRVLTISGRGIFGATVTLTDANGNLRTARTNAFGYYRFQNVAAGAIYIFQARHKHYEFASQVINLTEEMNNLTFRAAE